MTDIEIVEGCKRYESKHQKMLLDKYSPHLMATAMRYVLDEAQAKDALQETWIKVFRNIDNYKEEGRLMYWLKKILVNTIISEKRKNKPMVEINGHEPQNQQPGAESKLNMQDMMKIIVKLPSPSKEVFMMKVMEGMKHKEIAEIMNITESTSRVHLTNARKLLRMMFANYNDLVA